MAIAGAVLAAAWANAEAKVLFAANQLDAAAERTIAVRFGNTGVIQTGAFFSSLAGLEGIDWVLAVEQGRDYTPVALGDRGPRVPVWPVAISGQVPKTPLPCDEGGRDRICVSSGALEAVAGIAPAVAMQTAADAELVSAVGPLDADDPALAFASRGALMVLDPSDVRWAELGQVIVRVLSAPDYDRVLDAVTAAAASLSDPAVSVESRVSERSLLQSALSQAYDSKQNQALGAAAAAGTVALAISAVSVLLRRSDLGRRRVLGAGRADILHFVVLRVALIAGPASGVGVAAGVLLGLRFEEVTPSAPLAAGWAVGLAAVAAVASLPVAVIAGFRDPIRVLRVP